MCFTDEVSFPFTWFGRKNIMIRVGQNLKEICHPERECVETFARTVVANSRSVRENGRCWGKSERNFSLTPKIVVLSG